MAANREIIFRQFGPQALEAIVLLVFKQINVLRTKAGMQTISAQDALDALETEISSTTKYDWQGK